MLGLSSWWILSFRASGSLGFRTPVFSDTHEGGRHKTQTKNLSHVRCQGRSCRIRTVVVEVELVGPRSSSYSVFTDGELASGKIWAAPVFTSGIGDLASRRGWETRTREKHRGTSGNRHGCIREHRSTSRRDTRPGHREATAVATPPHRDGHKAATGTQEQQHGDKRRGKGRRAHEHGDGTRRERTGRAAGDTHGTEHGTSSSSRRWSRARRRSRGRGGGAGPRRR